MAVPFSNTKLRVPKGFQNILECLAREVLRSQPDNIHEFAAAYFENMMKVRAETGHDPAIHGAKLEDRNYNNETFKKKSVDPSDPQQNNAALQIQTQFRQHAAKEEVGKMREEDAAVRIQAGFRGYLDREQVRHMKTGDEGHHGEEEIDIDLEDPDVEKAAIKIQAGFKGFKARKSIQGDRSTLTPPASPRAPEEEIDIDLNDPDVGKAAIKIQAGFRGLQARKSYEQKQELRDQQQQQQEQQEADEQEDKEEVDIDLNDPEVERAAVKIQAGFKGLKTRRELKQSETADAEPSQEAEETKPQEEEVDIDLDDPATEKAALKIQAGFRGYQTRKDMGKDQEQEAPSEAQAEEPAPQATEAAPAEEPTQEAAPEATEGGEAQQEEEIDIDLNDPEVEKAATKIQAGFKGFKARKEIESKKEEGGEQKEGEGKAEEGEGQAEEGEGQAEEGEGQTEEATQESSEQEKVDIDLEDPEVEKAAVKIQAGFKGMRARQEVKAKLDSKKSEESQEGEKEKEEGEQEGGQEKEEDEM